MKLIDGEYCDITFNDSHFTPFDSLPTKLIDFEHGDYIDFFEVSEAHRNSVECVGARDRIRPALEVMVLLNGHILSVDFLPLKNATYFFSALSRKKNTIELPYLDKTDKIPFMKIINGEVKVCKVALFKRRYLNQKENEKLKNNNTAEFYTLKDNEVISLERNTVQVFIRHYYTPPALRPAPFFISSKRELKTIGATFTSLMGLLLLLLFVDTSKVPQGPKKKISVIYRAKPKPPPVKDPPPPKEVTKKKEAPPKAVKKKIRPKKIARKVAQPKKIKRRPAAAAIPKRGPKRVAKSPPPKKAPIKSYSFSAKGQLKNLFQTAKSAQSNKLVKNTIGAHTRTSAPTVSRNLAVGNLPSAASSRNIGADARGYDLNVDSRGLSTKKGVRTIYQSPPKVLLGAMDPELLRRLLQEYMPQFRHCYQQELQRNNKAKGVVSLMFRIIKNGSVQKVRVGKKGGQVFSSKGVQCIGSVLSLIEFPSPKGGGIVDVRQPLNFLSVRAGG